MFGCRAENKNPRSWQDAAAGIFLCLVIPTCFEVLNRAYSVVLPLQVKKIPTFSLMKK